MKTELLISINKTNLFGTSENAFKHLLMAGDQISFSKSNMMQYNGSQYTYELSTFNSESVDVISYHFIFSDNSLNDQSSSDKFSNYIKLQNYIQQLLKQNSKNLEVLWDDISFYYAQKAYPLIYEIENQMRLLISKFMIINVGTKWETENVPSKIKSSKSLERSNQHANSKNRSGILYNLDFIELSYVLFNEYALKENIRELSKLETITQSDIEPYIPRSNWERYFKKIVNIEADHLKKVWTSLYEYRCKIAHNNRFLKEDFDKVAEYVAEMKPAIQKAISELNSIRIDSNDKEIISENVASLNNEVVGKFIVTHNLLFNEMRKLTTSKGIVPIRRMVDELHEKGIINDAERDSIMKFTFYRNRIVHETGIYSNDFIEALIPIMSSITDKLKEKGGNCIET